MDRFTQLLEAFQRNENLGRVPVGVTQDDLFRGSLFLIGEVGGRLIERDVGIQGQVLVASRSFYCQPPLTWDHLATN